jgi:phospholipid transport system substrate-binding protein
LFSPVQASATSAECATKFINDLSNKALQVLSADGVSLEEKERNVRALLSNSFDFGIIGRFVMGRAWKKSSPDQKEHYQGLFKDFVLRTYSWRLGGYSGQQFTVVGTKEVGKRKDILVSYKISRSSGPEVLAGWRVREKNSQHRILDVMVSGVSMVATQRSEFAAVIRRDGVNGLIEMLRL